ncbi:MAG: hypothetical protein ABGX25_06700, partial [Nautiliaceae bacterium]
MRLFIHLFWLSTLMFYIFLNPYSNIYKVPFIFSFEIGNTKIFIQDLYIDNGLPVVLLNGKKLSINRPIKIKNFLIYLYNLDNQGISLKIQEENYLIYTCF